MLREERKEVTIFLRFMALIALASGLGVGAMFLCDEFIGPTHNVAAALTTMIAGGTIAILTLAIGSYRTLKK